MLQMPATITNVPLSCSETAMRQIPSTCHCGARLPQRWVNPPLLHRKGPRAKAREPGKCDDPRSGTDPGIRWVPGLVGRNRGSNSLPVTTASAKSDEQGDVGQC